MSKVKLASGEIEVQLIDGTNVIIFNCTVWQVERENDSVLVATVPVDYWVHDDKSSRMVKGTYSVKIRNYCVL